MQLSLRSFDSRICEMCSGCWHRLKGGETKGRGNVPIATGQWRSDYGHAKKGEDAAGVQSEPIEKAGHSLMALWCSEVPCGC